MAELHQLALLIIISYAPANKTFINHFKHSKRVIQRNKKHVWSHVERHLIQDRRST